jgi:hypothetical protein
MKKNSAALNLFLFFMGLTFISCKTGNNQSQNQHARRISEIQITDRTALHYYMKGKTVRTKTIFNSNQIKDFQVELDSMKEVQNVNIKYSQGSYDIILFFNDGTSRETALIYTIYDGVVFYDYNTNKSFKNNDMEVLVRNYF